jgi:hypothetical protein
MATSTIDANPGDNSILEDDNDPDLSLETGDDPVSAFNMHHIAHEKSLKL